MATPAPAEPLPTTPPSTYILTTTGEGALLTSLASGGIATRNEASSYSRSAYSHSTPGSDHTVVVGGSGNNGSGSGSDSSGSGSGGLVSGWNNLSNTTKYAIYAGAGVAVLLIIVLIVFVARRSRRKRRQPAEILQQGNARKDARMTQRSSFASPMHAMDNSTLRSNHNLQQGPQAGNDAYGRFDGAGNTEMSMMMQRNGSTYSMDKSGGGAYVGGDNYSVRSVPPMYGHASQQAQYHPDEAQYPPTSPEYSRDGRMRALSPALSQHSSAYGHLQNARSYGNGYAHQQQEHQEEQLAYGYDNDQGRGHQQQQYQQGYDEQYSPHGRPQQQQQQQQYPPQREYQQHPPRQGSQYSQQGYGY